MYQYIHRQNKLLKVADVANLSKDKRVLYDKALKRYRDYKNTIDYAEERGQKGRHLLRSKSHERERSSSPTIAEVTGLSEAEIETL